MVNFVESILHADILAPQDDFYCINVQFYMDFHVVLCENMVTVLSLHIEVWTWIATRDRWFFEMLFYLKTAF